MKRFSSTILAVIMVLGTCGVLMVASEDAGARGHSSGSRSSSGTRARTSGTRAHAPGVHGQSFRRGPRVGVFVAAPILASPSWYYVDPYLVQAEPAVYVEQGADGAAHLAQVQQQYWFYCQESGIYYPYVQNCAVPWQQVVPHAPQ